MQAARCCALVTGASAGIGEAYARALAGQGFDLVLVARRGERLAALAAALRRAHGIEVLCVVEDLGVAAAAERVLAAVSEAGLRVDYLVNNAGFGVPGSYHDQPWETHAHTLEVMVTAVAALTHGCLAGMRERGYGRIVNVASVAGLLPGSPGHTLYEAVKAWMVCFSESLAFENAGTGVNVCALCPGFTWSEFHDVTGTREQVSRFPGFMWWQAEDVVAEGIEAVEQGRPVHVPGRVYRAIVWLFRILPRPLARALIRRQSRHFRKQ